ncbi:BCAM0308 family protein [Herminiimonas sp. CN]|uniref:BCAM0308 family protein n=1 Tax=Herminiimonas sp. CN TaxID=1349818 RepID=UPI0004730F08|nr:BCAM0308 family protein [Herminiimonas sp. CN]
MKKENLSSAGFQHGRHFGTIYDTNDDPYQRDKLSEPAVCSDCGAVYHDGRWQWILPTANAHKTQCPACKRIHEKLPAGYVSIEGEFAQKHSEEVRSLIQNVEAHEKSEHPLQRIMSIEENAGNLLITTTDIHLARGIGEALHNAYKGDLNFHYNKSEYLLRVHWQR